ncbi:MAG: gas vesicle protein GvpJ [Longimicrobiales bacterium]
MTEQPAAPGDPELTRHLGLVELVNRVLDRGAVVTGEVVVSVAGVDLLYLGLQLVLTSVETARQRSLPPADG